MRLFDTARQATVSFAPQEQTVSLYVCGITPYDAAHLGHAFTYHVFDVFTRRMQSLGVEVRSVRNVTDVDDDILRVARERGLPFQELAESQVRQFEEDMLAIDILPVTQAPRATRHVDDMVPWVQRLIDANLAYERAGWVFFRVAGDPGYGRISHLGREEMLSLSRQRGADPDDRRKEDPLDFVLWQRSAEDEPSWESPWGRGRPGWHIECTVLSTGTLGTPIDVHGGGDDLIFPHHECEAAQAEGAGIAPYVRHWVHVAMVRYQGQKMSKSLGNLVFVRDLLQRTSAASVRLLLASHRRGESWEYEESMLRDADARRDRYLRALDSDARLDSGRAAELQRRFEACIDDDLDTASALSVADDAASELLSGVSTTQEAAVPAAQVLEPMLRLLGVRLTQAADALPARAWSSGAAPSGDIR